MEVTVCHDRKVFEWRPRSSRSARWSVPADAETANVRESWTGSDYRVQVTITSSNSGEYGAPESASIVLYDAGSVVGYDANGTYQSSYANGGTAFDLVTASSEEVQASYDEPFYGIYGGGGGGGGGTCIELPCGEMVRSIPGEESVRTKPVPPGFKHDVTRKGVRHLLNAYEEVQASSASRRRFRRQLGNIEKVIELDRSTDLMVQEEEASPGVTTVAKHFWRRLADGTYVKTRTEIQADRVLPSGLHAKDRTTVKISNVRRGQP